jgi:hypothetical protein
MVDTIYLRSESPASDEAIAGPGIELSLASRRPIGSYFQDGLRHHKSNNFRLI